MAWTCCSRRKTSMSGSGCEIWFTSSCSQQASRERGGGGQQAVSATCVLAVRTEGEVSLLLLLPGTA